MEGSQSLLLNEEAFKVCPDPKKPLFIYEWLRFLDKVLSATNKNDLKSCQKELISQLITRINSGPGPSTRHLLSKCIGKIYTIGDSIDLFNTIAICNDILKGKEESSQQLSVKLTALSVLSALYESVGRLVGRSFEETFSIISKWIRSAESLVRAEILNTITKIILGLGNASTTIHRDTYKSLVKPYLTDRVLSVRIAAVNCLHALVKEYPTLYTMDIDAVATLLIKSLDVSNYYTRLAVADVFATLTKLAIKNTQPNNNGQGNGNIKVWTIESSFNLLSDAFIRGGIGGFLKSTVAITNISSFSSSSKEIRNGITLAYIRIIKKMGAKWLERNQQVVITHLLSVITKIGPIASSDNSTQLQEALHMRRCISFIFRKTFGQIISEPSQISVCKMFGIFLGQFISNYEVLNELNTETIPSVKHVSSSQICTVILLEISALVQQIGSSVSNLFTDATGIMEPVFASLLHPIQSTRVAAAWTLRCVACAVPSLLTPLIDRCISRLEHMKTFSIAIEGYSSALASLLTASKLSPLGVPFSKSKQVFQLAEDLLRSASSTSNITQQKVKAAWLLLTSLILSDPLFIRPYISKLKVFWKNSFPKDKEEAEAENQRGDVKTWIFTLTSRSGALASINAFLINCKEDMNENIEKKMYNILESSLMTLAQVATLLKSHGTALRPYIYELKIRLYELLINMETVKYNSLNPTLLRELVADISLSDNSSSTTITSLSLSSCSLMESNFLGGWLKTTDESGIEMELHQHRSHLQVIDSLENDIFESLTCTKLEHGYWPEILLSSVKALDLSIVVFSRLYPTLASKHKIQLTEHFKEVIKTWQRSPIRQYSIQLNVLTALLLSIKCLSECRNAKMENENLRKANFDLVSSYINHEKIPLRCLTIEFLSRMAQITKDASYVAGIAQYCFDKLHTLKDEKSRASFGITIGVLHNYVGSLGSNQHLNTSVSITLALAQDPSSPTVQSWAIFALSLIANTGSGMFKSYVEPCLSLCLRLLLNVSPYHVDIIRSLGKLTSALITAVGPELQSAVGAVENIRSSFLVACSMMFENNDIFVKSEAIACFQQLHIFAPRFVELDWLVKKICHLMYSQHLVLRKSSIACLKQLLQRESIEVKEHASSLVPQSMIDMHGKNECILPETGLEGGLFELLDIETDTEMICNIQESIIFLVQATGGEFLNFWMLMVKDILASSTNEMTILTGEKDENDKNTDEDDDSTFNISNKNNENNKDKLLPRWPARVFALEVVQKLMQLCETERAHLDLALAKELQLSSSGKADYLVLHLSDLIRMAFMGATSDNTKLRLAGLATLQDIIKRFAHVSEPEFPGHVILEQFQAQVGAALRPAFEQDTPSHITAAACEVCSTWIGSGVVRDINDLKRVHNLLVSSLTKLKSTGNITPLYNESTATLEKLAILKAWSEVYIVAIEKNNEENSLLHLVDPELNFLVIYWMAALRDAALLSLPPEYNNQLPDDGGSFYIAECVDSCKDYYRDVWPTILLASSIWLSKTNFELTTEEHPTCRNWKNMSKETRFDIMIGMCLEALCCVRNVGDIDSRVKLCLKSIHFMMESIWFQEKLMSDVQKCIEIVNALHRIILTRDNLSTQKMCAEVAGDIIKIVIVLKQQTTVNNDYLYIGMEGENGCFDTKRSLAFALLEFCLCLLVRQIPQINTALMNSKTMTPLHFRKYAKLPNEGHELIKVALQLLSQIPHLCHYRGTIVILPSILYMILGVIRESARKDNDQIINDTPPGHVSLVSATAIQALRSLLSNPLRDEDNNMIKDDNGNNENDIIFQEWCTEIRSAMLSLALMDSNPNIPVDQSIILLSLTVMITSVPPDFVLGSQLFGKTCKIFKSVINSDMPKVKLTALQGIISIFSKKDISKAYIKILGPLVTIELKKVLQKAKALEGLPNEIEELNDCDYLILPELCKILTTILENITEDKQFQLTALLIQVLVSFVIPTPEVKFKNISKNGKQLNDFCLNQLTYIAKNYTENFKQCIASIPILKIRIEDGLKYQSLRSTQQLQLTQMMHGNRKGQNKNQISGKPKIKLATDFNTKFD